MRIIPNADIRVTETGVRRVPKRKEGKDKRNPECKGNANMKGKVQLSAALT